MYSKWLINMLLGFCTNRNNSEYYKLWTEFMNWKMIIPEPNYTSMFVKINFCLSILLSEMSLEIEVVNLASVGGTLLRSLTSDTISMASCTKWVF